MNPQGRDGGGDRRGVPVRWRLPLLAGGALALVGGLYAGLVLLGLPVAGTATDTADSVAAVHGPVMVFGFVGTLVALERAVALGARWALLAPACSALGAVALLIGGPGLVGRLLLCVAGVVLLGVYAALWRRQATVALLAQAAGALCWYAAALLWAGGFPISRSSRGWQASWWRPSRANASSCAPRPGGPARRECRRRVPRSARRGAGRRGGQPAVAVGRVVAVGPVPARPGGLAGRLRRGPAHRSRPRLAPGTSPSGCWPATAGSPWPDWCGPVAARSPPAGGTSGTLMPCPPTPDGLRG